MWRTGPGYLSPRARRAPWRRPGGDCPPPPARTRRVPWRLQSEYNTNEIYFQVTDESLKEVERILARSEAPGATATATTTSNIRPGYKPSIKPLIDNNLNGSTSYRSEIFKTKVKFFNISAPGHCLTQLTTASPGCRRQQRPGRVCGGSP